MSDVNNNKINDGFKNDNYNSINIKIDYIIKELNSLKSDNKSLIDKMDFLKDELNNIKSEFTEVKTIRRDLDLVVSWKDEFSSKVTLKQIEDVIKMMEDYNKFKVKITTIIVVLQVVLSALVIIYDRFFK